MDKTIIESTGDENDDETSKIQNKNKKDKNIVFPRIKSKAPLNLKSIN